MPTMQEITTIPRVKPNEHYKQRVKALRGKLPKNWRGLVLEQYKEYDDAHGLNFLNNVFYCKLADVRVTLILEAMARDFEQNN